MFHDEHGLGAVHIPYNGEYADATEREAATGFVAGRPFVDGWPTDDPPGDLGKLALQRDDYSLWMLIAVTPTWKAVGNTTTGVTATGTLTADAIVLGNGGTDSKTASGLTTDGTSRIQLGVAGASVGGVELRNATSGTASIVPPTGALGTAVHVLPAGSGTLFSTTTKTDVLQAAEYAADAGANDTYAITLAPAITAYTTGARYRFKANTANTGAATLNINSVGAQAIKKLQGGVTTALDDNDIRAGQMVEVVWDGTNFQMISALGNAPTAGFSSSTATDVLQAAIFASDAGSNDTYVATLTPAPSGYVAGVLYRFKANTANTGACTINFNSLGAKTIKKAAGGITTDLDDNDIRAGQWVDLVYDGTNMQMQSLLGNAASGAGDMLLGTAQTVTAAKTFNAGTLKIASGGDLVDANGNELFKFTATASAVNELTLANAATGNRPTITATGGDSNVGIGFVTKGAGTFRLASDATNHNTVFLDTGGASSNTQLIFAVTAVTQTLIATTTVAGNVVTGSLSGDMILRTNSGRMILSTDNGSSIAYTFSTSGIVTFDGTSPILILNRSGVQRGLFGISNATDNIITGSAANDWCIRCVSTNALFSTDNGSSAHLKLTANNGTAIFASAIQTAAPSGGTAATFKVGVAASVSPTAPNRTIQLDVGGTLYYLHAKTTND
jgi:hypothetical protein